MPASLEIVEQKLKVSLSKMPSNKGYYIPGLWENPFGKEYTPVETNPFLFFLNKIREIKGNINGCNKQSSTGSICHKNVFNMLTRLTTAYDHDNNGKVDIGTTCFGLRETGTFLKSISLLPYIRSLGAGTVYLLPVTSIGKDGRKGSLGSPYAIKNHYKLDENLSEPILELPVETQFAAFVEAAHMLEMKVVTEFVFRTGSKDNDLALEHPDWFYWIKANIPDRYHGADTERSFGNPVFSHDKLKNIKELVEDGNFSALPEPDEAYKKLFTKPPVKTARIDGRIIGITENGNECRIPGAFCDWPPDDLQPPWSDVTYLRMYSHKDFNYMAYNTLRMYDARLSMPKYEMKSLWNYIENIVPYYQDNFGIDGVMIDMGHALPEKLRAGIIKKAREKNRGFIFWEENFTLSKKSVREGYNAVVGYLWADQHIPKKLGELIKLMASPGVPIPFFLTPETHNTPRAASRMGGIEYSKACFVINTFLPGIHFIHSGYELGELQPVNTGLGFTEEELSRHTSESLPLFSIGNLNWYNKNIWIDFIRNIQDIESKYFDVLHSDDLTNICYLESGNDYIVAFCRKSKIRNIDFILIINVNPEKEMYFCVKLPKNKKYIYDINLNSKFSIINDEIIYNLKPFDYIMGEII